MKIGIFDSGLGGLSIAKAFLKELPEYDYVYLGDTARVPYGNRSQEAILQFTKEGVQFLFEKDCSLVIIACNTASAEALRNIQQNFLPENYPDKCVLGVLIPSVEAVIEGQYKKVGVIATNGTVNSGAFVKEIRKRNPEIEVFQEPAPLLVPLVENNGFKWAPALIEEYITPLLNNEIDALILGCTHYPFLLSEIQNKVGKLPVISQDTVVPQKLKVYLQKHPERKGILTCNREREFYLTDVTPQIITLGVDLLGEKVDFYKAFLKTVS